MNGRVPNCAVCKHATRKNRATNPAFISIRRMRGRLERDKDDLFSHPRKNNRSGIAVAQMLYRKRGTACNRSDDWCFYPLFRI
jgi:hypothetical protein